MFHGFIQTMKAGGVTLGIIVFCSVLALAVGIERIVALWRFLDRARTLGETVKRGLYRGALAEARAACERSSSLAAEFFLVGFERLGRSSANALEAAVDRERQRVALALKGQLWILATIGAIAPFVGLFGTVWGILRAFDQIGATHQAGIDVVGPGIAEALVTTAAGIIVAIESMVIYNYFMQRLGRTSLELKLMSEEFVELLREQKPDQKSDPRSTGESRVVETPVALATKPSPSEA
ncbi:MAG TPA: MotA/TolQ/ExbB proton channel family protein [Polyangia bacterium]|jgi:biopolymer transport protein ExbB|nr:MotA/TolQ/ExbB proton channel family protein [Polyangia bacterium]